jgi:tetratricopeptide (TPR) repeat protein
VARGLNNLAVLLSATSRLAVAEPLYRRALAVDEKSFGPDHPNVARGLNNLAFLLSDTNRLAEAEPLYRRALAIDEKSFGPDHPDVAIDLNNCGICLFTDSSTEAYHVPFLIFGLKHAFSHEFPCQFKRPVSAQVQNALNDGGH